FDTRTESCLCRHCRQQPARRRCPGRAGPGSRSRWGSPCRGFPRSPFAVAYCPNDSWVGGDTNTTRVWSRQLAWSHKFDGTVPFRLWTTSIGKVGPTASAGKCTTNSITASLIEIGVRRRFMAICVLLLPTGQRDVQTMNCNAPYCESSLPKWG